MRYSIYIIRAYYIRPLFTAGILLATALTFSCGNHGYYEPDNGLSDVVYSSYDGDELSSNSTVVEVSSSSDFDVSSSSYDNSGGLPRRPMLRHTL